MLIDNSENSIKEKSISLDENQIKELI